MKKEFLMEGIIALMVLLFVYAGSSKLVDMNGFKAGMLIQPFPAWVNKVLAATLPFAEIIIAAGLVFKLSRRPALYAYAGLMLCFTGYTGLVVAGYFAHRPCSCGGIISGLSWGWHFFINLIFSGLTGLAIRMHSRQTILYNQGVSRKPVRE